MEKFILFFFLIFIIYFFIKLLNNQLLKKRKEQISISLNSNIFIEKINSSIEQNKYNLIEERRRLKRIDPYGNEDFKRWIGNPPLNEYEVKDNLLTGGSKFSEGIPYFWHRVLVKEFGNVDIFFEKWESYRIRNPHIDDEIIGSRRPLNRDDWYIFIASIIEKLCIFHIEQGEQPEKESAYKKGLNFENHCLQILKSKGWNVQETPLSGDQGVDLIASISNRRLCIQCKNHKNPCGNKAVQEVSAGKTYWEGTHAVLVSKSGFTKSAYRLASANNVILINEIELENIEDLIL